MKNTPETRADAEAAARTRMLRDVNAHKVVWNPNLGVCGGFISIMGRAYDVTTLLALHQLNADGAFEIPPSGRVELTDKGRRLLADPTLYQTRGVA